MPGTLLRENLIAVVFSSVWMADRTCRALTIWVEQTRVSSYGSITTQAVEIISLWLDFRPRRFLL